MSELLTFIIPVRHPRNAADWRLLKANLASTIRSVAAQTHAGWKAIVVANHGSDLPELPAGFAVQWVDFPPNVLHDGGNLDANARQAFRRDKGYRVLAGMFSASLTNYFMIVDDDDFISCKLVAFVSQNPSANGWYIRNGYLWGHGGNLLCCHANFSELCGTSLIIRSDLYALPQTVASASDDYVCRMLGSHTLIKPHLDRAGTPLEPLPFPGAVYRLGHAGAHSKSRGLLSHVFLRKALLKNPLEFPRRVLALRRLSRSLRQEFFGATATADINSPSAGVTALAR